MKVIWIILMVLSASISASMRGFEAVGPPLTDEQDGVSVTQEVIPQDDGTLCVRLKVDMEEDIAALQQQAAQADLSQVQLLDPTVVRQRESMHRAASGLWQLHIPMSESAHVIAADTALQISKEKDEICFDVSPWMRGERPLPAQAEYRIDLRRDTAYLSREGYLFQMQSRFAYVSSLQETLPIVKRMVISAPKVRLAQS
ncbi:MAG TPA: hypothetical protein H9702_07005 [Candidatus Merdibacter merdavium]|uniref:Uncharacterized protein n=1 Tax=Candidatus Merdibacter merdavium TaxID=2838692 RepID=A0A9D2NTV5_9FIRM|nr:hypothetical protein [Candidatus Merdibacter merdavium]